MFLVMPDSDRTMQNIFLTSYLYNLGAIIKEYESRLIKYDPILRDNNS